MRRRYVVPVVEPQVSVPSVEDLCRAAELIGPWVRRTPVLEVELDGRAIALKLELLQHAGSFKVRGAFTTVLSAPERPAALVAASGGNHGLAVAHVGMALDIPARIFLPESAPALKVRAIAARGADVRQVGSTYAEALEASREEAARPGTLALHAYDAPGTVTGQGTVGLEIAEQVPGVETVLVAVGGGGLVAGTTIGLRGGSAGAASAGGEVGVLAVEPQACPTLHRALAEGGPVDVTVGGVAADALGASRLGSIAWEVVRRHGVRSRLVGDDAIREARRWLWAHARIAAEPAGATALAALLSGAYVPAPDERVCVIVCGGNADPSDL